MSISCVCPDCIAVIDVKACSESTARRHSTTASMLQPPVVRCIVDAKGTNRVVLWLVIPFDEWEARPKSAEELQSYYVQYGGDRFRFSSLPAKRRRRVSVPVPDSPAWAPWGEILEDNQQQQVTCVSYCSVHDQT
jgi:hypothetical protein